MHTIIVGGMEYIYFAHFGKQLWIRRDCLWRIWWYDTELTMSSPWMWQTQQQTIPIGSLGQRMTKVFLVNSKLLNNILARNWEAQIHYLGSSGTSFPTSCRGRDGRSWSMKWCATRTTTASQCVTWRTLTLWASTQAALDIVCIGRNLSKITRLAD